MFHWKRTQIHLRRPEVLEYVLYKVLNMDYEEFDVPESCKNALDEYKEFNDPIRQFFNDVVERASWDIMPFALLYEMYLKWFKANNPSGTPQNRHSLTTSLLLPIKVKNGYVKINENKFVLVTKCHVVNHYLMNLNVKHGITSKNHHHLIPLKTAVHQCRDNTLIDSEVFIVLVQMMMITSFRLSSQVTINIKFNNNKKERYICHELLY